MLPNALQPNGTFWFFFATALLGLLWVNFVLPETSQKSLEETSETYPYVLVSLSCSRQRRETVGGEV